MNIRKSILEDENKKILNLNEILSNTRLDECISNNNINNDDKIIIEDYGKNNDLLLRSNLLLIFNFLYNY